MKWHPATEALLKNLEGLVVRDRQLADCTTYRVGGPAAGFVEVESVATLERIRNVRADLLKALDFKIPILLIGKGSNLLIADRGFDGLVLRLGGSFEEIEIDEMAGVDGRHKVRVGGAALLPIVARQTVSAALTGFEWAVGVPGSVGGAVRMNAGGHGSDMAASLIKVSVFDLLNGGPEEWSLADLGLAYRTSSLGSDQFVLFAELGLFPGDAAVAKEALSEIVRWRREHQPGGANAGSVFANPEGDSAGRMIEAVGLKGYRFGTAQVSTKHANFIQVDPDGSADDVFALIQHVRRQVVNTLGVDLQPENHTVGFDTERT